MQHEARKVGAVPIYMNGGSGLFLVDTYEAAKTFAESMQQAYRNKTRGGASITCVIQELPEDENIPNDLDGIMKYDLGNILELMRYRLREAKDSPSSVIALASHPFMRPCQACGIEYAEEKDAREQEEPDALYFPSCLKKRSKDYKVKDRIDWILPLVQKSENVPQEYLWDRILFYLNNAGYEIPEGTQRPNDFNEFRRFTKAKEYLGLIYADANGMCN